ncbi:uncharacterized protein LOC126783761 isoform X2 [Argentina anserina]|nr:uncharacterized protein LOC126783761 isoform X2 [Potentilla anserina]
MALRSAASLSRSLASTARVSLHRSAPNLRRVRPPTRRFSFTSPRNFAELGCAESLLPMRAATCFTSHMTVNMRAYCELSHGT